MIAIHEYMHSSNCHYYRSHNALMLANSTLSKEYINNHDTSLIANYLNITRVHSYACRYRQESNFYFLKNITFIIILNTIIKENYTCLKSNNLSFHIL